MIKRCWWKFIKKSFEGNDTNQQCKKCNGYNKECHAYKPATNKDIISFKKQERLDRIESIRKELTERPLACRLAE